MEKLLVTSSFCFSHNVFHSYVSLVRQYSALCLWVIKSLTSYLFCIELIKLDKFIEKAKIRAFSYLATILLHVYFTSNFSFSHNVFHSYISLVSQNATLFCNGLTLYHTPDFNDHEIDGFGKH